jgi:hypothetical protein
MSNHLNRTALVSTSKLNQLCRLERHQVPQGHVPDRRRAEQPEQFFKVFVVCSTAQKVMSNY